MPKYRITSGTFRDSDDSIKGEGDIIELGTDVAEANASRLELVPDQADELTSAASEEPAP